MFGCFAVMPRRVLVMLGCFDVMLCRFSGHSVLLFVGEAGRKSNIARLPLCDEAMNSLGRRNSMKK